MKISEITKIQIKIIINESLHKKNIIDDETYSLANEILLKSYSKYRN